MNKQMFVFVPTILVLTWAATGCQSPRQPASPLEHNRTLKAQLAEKQQAVKDAREENRQRRLETQNLEKCVQQMESVVAAVRDPENHHIIVPPLEKVEVLDVILEEPLDGCLSDTAALDPKKGRFVDMQDGRKALRIVVDPKEEKKDRRVGFRLPADQLAGSKLRCTVLAKAEDISKPPVHWGGGKFQLCVKTSGKTQWPAASIGGGTFDWKQLEFTYDVPFDATAITLLLGLETVSGTIYFRDLKVETIEP